MSGVSEGVGVQAETNVDGISSTVSEALRKMRWRFFFIVLIALPFSTGGRATCAPPDEAGIAHCVSLALRPTPIPAIVLILIAMWLSAAATRTTRTDAETVDLINTVCLWVLAIMAIGTVVGQVYFWSIPIEGWPHPNLWISPFPFSSIDVVTSVA